MRETWRHLLNFINRPHVGTVGQVGQQSGVGEYRLLRETKEVTVYAEYAKPSCLEDIVSRCHTLGVKVVDLEVTKKSDASGNSPAQVRASASLPKY